MNERTKQLAAAMVQLYNECWNLSPNDEAKSIVANDTNFEIVDGQGKNREVLFTLKPGIPNYDFEQRPVTLESLFNKFSNQNEYRSFREILKSNIDLDSITNESGKILVNDDIFAFLGSLFPQIVIGFYNHLQQSMIINSVKIVCVEMTVKE